ncbi:MAG TPA: SDR family NAD(P)-dependent oxidoreductase [Acidimicrobiales bacterium]|jgi:FlaA1/EpsC-like NDP-sugar epimerase
MAGTRLIPFTGGHPLLPNSLARQGGEPMDSTPYVSRQRFEAKTVIVTGAASGIGRETAVRFAAEGASVVVADISEAGGLETTAQIAESGAPVRFIRKHSAPGLTWTS